MCCCPTATMRRGASSSREKASLDYRPGSVEGFGAVVDFKRHDGARAAVGAMGAGEPTVGRLGNVRGDTVHFDIIDSAGNMISATPSGGWLQSSPVIPEIGFCLGSRAQMFFLEEDHPAALGPGRRPRTTLSPTMALRDGEPYLAWGSPGGDQQDQWITQFFLRHVHAGMNLQECDRCAGLALRALPDLVLAAHRAPGRAGGRGPRAEGDGRRADASRPYRRGRARLVGRPPDGRFARRHSGDARPPIRAACKATRPGDEVMTWSIIARDPATGDLAIAVATKFFAVGSRVPHHRGRRRRDRDAGARPIRSMASTA